MSKPVSLQDVAVRAGVHATTVSMALRGHPRIPAATRERIARIAAKLDYRPNPLVSALMHYRRARRQLIVQATLAWITDYPTRDGWKDPDMERAYRAAADRAHELGFKLDPHWAAEPGLSPARFRQVLAARGITGAIVSRLPHGVSDLAIDVSDLSAVGFGVTLQTPELHRVAYNHFDVVRHAVDESVARGYRRLGLALVGGYEIVDEIRKGAFVTAKDRHPALKLAPIYHADREDEAGLRAWFRRHRPDAILTASAPWIRRCLASERARVPERVGVVSLDISDPASRISGFYQGYDLLATTAVDLLVSMIYRNERGVPEQPQKVLIMGRWMEGGTLRPLKRG